jgi:hypothetical protein
MQKSNQEFAKYVAHIENDKGMNFIDAVKAPTQRFNKIEALLEKLSKVSKGSPDEKDADMAL